MFLSKSLKMHLPIILKRLFFLVPVLGTAQDQFSGIVYDLKTQEPVPFVHFVYEKNKGFISDQKGTFSYYISDEENEEIEVVASAIGYESKKFQLQRKKKSSYI